MDRKILLTNIQRFSIHDGPGIRTTVFLKGCILRCPWCCNPENIECRVQDYVKDGVREKYGRWYNTKELYDEVMKDVVFYRRSTINTMYYSNNNSLLGTLPGGITFSGGEPLLQIKELSPLLEKLKAEHIHTAIETCLFVAKENLSVAINFINLFFIDIKIMDKEECSRVLCGDIDIYEQNLSVLMKSGRPVILRVPVIGNYTDATEKRSRVVEKINECVFTGNVLKVEIIKEHNLGKSKYNALKAVNSSVVLPHYYGVRDELLEVYKKQIQERINNAIPVEIYKI